MRFVRPLYIPPLKADHVVSGSLILRDGTTAVIRTAEPADAALLQQFVSRLSPESRRHRFFSESLPSADAVASLCESSDPRSQLTLLVPRAWEGQQRIIAAGSYWAKDEHTAEVAMAVDDAFHGKGLGTLLLERLADIIHDAFNNAVGITSRVCLRL
jgi:GNAT superfamily N-acetyltransferase